VTPTPYKDKGCARYNGANHNNFGLGCTKAPLAALYHTTFGLSWPDTAVPIPDTTTGPFNDFQPYLYWTGTAAPDGTQNGYKTVSFNTQWSGSNTFSHSMYTLPMIDGNPFGATGTTLTAVDGGSAVFEPVAGGHGLTWLADADYARTQAYGLDVDSDGSMDEPTAVTWVNELNTHALLGKTGWALPSATELKRLYGALGLTSQEPVVPVPDTTVHGFNDIQPYLYWSCAGASITGPCHGAPNPQNQQFSFSFGNGFLGTDITQNLLYVMVYYPNPVVRSKPPITCPPPRSGSTRTCV